MKTQPQQPAHTKGEKWDMKEEKDHFQITETNESYPQEPDVVAQVFGSYKEAKERSQRIVKAVNMHDELVQEIKSLHLLLNRTNPILKMDVKSANERIENLLKQAEQK